MRGQVLTTLRIIQVNLFQCKAEILGRNTSLRCTQVKVYAT